MQIQVQVHMQHKGNTNTIALSTQIQVADGVWILLSFPYGRANAKGLLSCNLHIQPMLSFKNIGHLIVVIRFGLLFG